VTIFDLVVLLAAQIQDATIVTSPTASSPAPIIHVPCSGTGFVNGERDAACDGTGQVTTPPLARITATGGIVTVAAIPVLT
jgi:hypothetical protein